MKNEIVIWGVGYIGFSNMIYYAHNGIKTIGYDVVSNKWDNIKDFQELTEFDKWLDFDFRYLFDTDYFNFITNYKLIDMQKAMCHLICVPTEKNSEPWDEPLYDVTNKIIDLFNNSNEKELTMVIESTMVPGTAEKILSFVESKINHGIVNFAVAPRRDWFVIDGGNLSNLPRVFGCNNSHSEQVIEDILSQVCNSLVKADDFRQAEMTKSIENAIRHVGITIANQFADAFPNIDIVRVLELAATKWNVELYYPSLGIGGYCIPLSSKYLVKADNNEKLSILREVINYNKNRVDDLTEIIEKESIKKVAVFGICYTGNVKVTKNSVIFEIMEKLKKHNVEIDVQDALYTNEELRNIYGFNPVDKNKKYDGLIFFCNHDKYKMMSVEELNGILENNKIIWDNCGMFGDYVNDFEKLGIKYNRVGRKDWR